MQAAVERTVQDAVQRETRHDTRSAVPAGRGVRHSALYHGVVTHHRRRPAEHRFDFRLYMLYLDLAELPALSRVPFFSTHGPSLTRFRRRDHLGEATHDLATSVRDLVAERTGHRPQGPIRLLTVPRCLGFSFNPISLYYCFDAAGERPEAIVAEVSNTPWNERHWYVLGAREGEPLRFDVAKAFHVSPFMDIAQRYAFRFSVPGPGLELSIASREEAQGRLFAAALKMERLPWTRASWARLLARHPLMSWQVFASIYWHAQRLKRKGVPWVPHPGEPSEPPAVRMEGCT